MEVDEKVLEYAKIAYRTCGKEITMGTKLRAEISNRSMLLLAFLSSLENEFDVMIPIKESGNLVTVQDFADRVKELMAK